MLASLSVHHAKIKPTHECRKLRAQAGQSLSHDSRVRSNSCVRGQFKQQARFDDFMEIFNNERPHEALGVKYPAEIYQPSPRNYQGLPAIDYPLHDKIIIVTNCDRICLGHKKINFSTVFAGQAVGIKEIHDDIWLVSFMDYDLGYFDLETRVLEPLDNPFGPKLLPM